MNDASRKGDPKRTPTRPEDVSGVDREKPQEVAVTGNETGSRGSDSTAVGSAPVLLRTADQLRALDEALRKLGPDRQAFAAGRSMTSSLGSYRIVGSLGRGGMGLVYRAIHTELNRPVALKVLLPDSLPGPIPIERFRREMRALGKLRHPHVVTAFDAGEIDGIHFLALELIEGSSVADILARCGPLKVADACELTRQAAIGLQFVHDQQWVHRDVKPSNLMLCPDGILKILDFGLALTVDDDDVSGEMTASGHPVGTRSYMAPEQVTDSHSVDSRTDIYSLGCTFYRMLAGRTPSVHGSVEYVDAPVAKLPPDDDAMSWLQKFRPTIPAEIVVILKRMLAADRSDRFESPSEVAVALERFCLGSDLKGLRDGPAAIDGHELVKSTGSSSPPSTRKGVAGEGFSRPSSRSPALVRLIAASTLLMGVVGLGLWKGSAIPFDKGSGGSTAAGRVGGNNGATSSVPHVGEVSDVVSDVSPEFITERRKFEGGWLVRQSYLGQSGDAGRPADDGGLAVATDKGGNVYVAGSVGFEGDSGTNPGPADLFVAKHSPGGEVIWRHRIGSVQGDDRAPSIAVDSGGDVYVAGRYQGRVDFDPGPLETIRESEGGTVDAFLLKLTTAGDHVWVKTFGQGSSRWDLAAAVTIDAAGEITLAGMHGGALDLGDDGMPLKPMSNSLQGLDLFILRLGPDGELKWAKRLGGDGDDSVMRLAQDTEGNVYLSGTFRGSVCFDPDDQSNATARREAGENASDAYLLKLHNDGSFAWVRHAAGDGFRYIAGLAISSDGVYAVGAFQNGLRFDPQATDRSADPPLNSQGEFDVMVAKLDPEDGGVIWSRQAFGLGDDRGRCLAITTDGIVHVVGHFAGKLSLGVGDDAPKLVSAGRTDGFVWQISSQGETLGGQRLGGGGSDSLRAICVAPDGALLLTGHLEGRADFSLPFAGGRQGLITLDGLTSSAAARGKDIFTLRLDPP